MARAGFDQDLPFDTPRSAVQGIPVAFDTPRSGARPLSATRLERERAERFGFGDDSSALSPDLSPVGAADTRCASPVRPFVYGYGALSVLVLLYHLTAVRRDAADDPDDETRQRRTRRHHLGALAAGVTILGVLWYVRRSPESCPPTGATLAGLGVSLVLQLLAVLWRD